MHFFVAPDMIVGQSIGTGFGPDPGDPTYRFQLTSRFGVQAGALAYSALKGTVLVQPVANSTTLVNLALRVLLDIGNPYTPTAYIIYRGILLSSLLVARTPTLQNPSRLAIAPSGTNDLVTQLWADKQASLLHTATLPVPAQDTEAEPSSLSLLGPELLAASDGLALDEIFNRPKSHQLVDIAEGRSLGTFDHANDIGIDIILVERLTTPTLATLRQRYNALEISPQDQATLQHESYAVRIQREALLAYIDPCAWYALRADEGISYRQGNLIQSATGRQQVYEQLLKRFTTCNNIYLDLRNEISHSLNFYQEYPSSTGPSDSTYYTFKVGADNTSPTTYAIPAAYRWPVYVLSPHSAQASQLPGSTTNIPAVFSSLQFSFQKTYNPDPLVYLEFAFQGRDFTQLPTSAERFVSEDPFKPISVPWSQAVRVQTPTVQDQGAQVNYCWPVKLMVLRQDLPTLLPTTALPRKNYLDNLFGPLIPLPDTIYGTGHQLPIVSLGKRWFYLKSKTGVRLGGIVNVMVQYTDKEVFFTTTTVDLYGDNEQIALNPSKFDSNGFSSYGALLIPPAPTADDAFLQQWANSTLGEGMYKFQVFPPPGYQGSAAVLGLVNKGPLLQHPGYLSLYLTRQEYNDVAAAAAIVFDATALSETTLCFAPFAYDKTTVPQAPRMTFRTELQMGGLTTGGTYQTTSGNNQYQSGAAYNSMPYLIPALSLDGFRFNSALAGAEALTNTLNLAKAPYPVAQFITDQQAAEAVYVTQLKRDIRLDQMVTRLRVHQYGFTTDNLSLNDPINHPIDSSKRALALSGKGLVFNLVIPYADYWEDNVVAGVRVAGNCGPGNRQVPPQGYDATIIDSCRVRQLYVDEDDELGLDLRTRLATRLETAVDPDGLKVDLRHSIFVFDSLFVSPIPGRPTTRKTSRGYEKRGITDASDLAGFIGDITGSISVAYAAYYTTEALRASTTLDDVLDLTYLITTPLDDLASDADGFGYYDVWTNVFQQRQDVTLSQVLAHYYSTADTSAYPNHTYKKRWKIFCEAQQLIHLTANGTYDWRPDTTDLNRRILAGYRVGYYPEVTALAYRFGLYLASEGRRVFLPPEPPALQDTHRDLVRNTFLTQVKNLLIAENSCQLNPS